MDGRDPSRSEASRGHVGNVRSPSDGRDRHRELLNIERCTKVVEELHDRGPIELRSSRDRGAIEARSHIFHPIIIPTGSDGGRPRSRTILTPDRGLIVARSCHDRGSC